MIFAWWIIANLIFPKFSPVSGSFKSGISSSIGVLPSSEFPTISAENLPLEGIKDACVICGWIFAAAGTTAPGFFIVPNFGSFNLGVNNTGQSNVGYNNIGFGNYGYNNIGRLNNGNDNIGYLNDGKNNMGALNTGTSEIGDNNSGKMMTNGDPCIGYNNEDCSAVIGTNTKEATYAIGSELEGSYLIGKSLTGTALVGEDNNGRNSIGFQNKKGSVNGNIGVLNTGDGLVGYNNIGSTVIGQDNLGSFLIGLQNFGIYEIGYNNSNNNTGKSLTAEEMINIGFNQVGISDIGVLNEGNFLTGFDLNGINQTGGTYIDTGDISLSIPIIFDPTELVGTENIGSDYNSQPSEKRTHVNTPFIRSIDAAWQFNLDFPAILSIVDLGCPGDIIKVYDQLTPITTTTFPRSTPVTINCTGLNDPEEALADPNYSRNFVTLQPGYHVLTFSLVKSKSITGTVLAFKLDLILPPSPCDECGAPVPPLEGFDPNPLVPPLPPFTLPPGVQMYRPGNCIKSNSEDDDDDSEGSNESADEDSNEVTNSTINPNTTTVAITNNTTYNLHPHPQNSSFTLSRFETKMKKNTKDPWCRSNNYQMLRDSYVTHFEATAQCLSGLARPSTPGDQLEITSLLFQCTPTQPTPNTEVYKGGQWIGSDWTGGRHGTDCLVAIGENVRKALNCDSRRRFICNRM